jgi:hypothetical protein
VAQFGNKPLTKAEQEAAVGCHIVAINERYNHIEFNPREVHSGSFSHAFK